MLRITMDGEVRQIDPQNLLLSEAEILEEFAGVDVEQLASGASLKKMRMVGHLLWIVKLRQVAADKQISLREAAAACPRDQFDISLGNLVIEEVKAAAPKETRTPTTRTPRTASSRPRKPSASSGSRRSAGSAST